MKKVQFIICLSQYIVQLHTLIVWHYSRNLFQRVFRKGISGFLHIFLLRHLHLLRGLELVNLSVILTRVNKTLGAFTQVLLWLPVVISVSYHFSARSPLDPEECRLQMAIAAPCVVLLPIPKSDLQASLSTRAPDTQGTISSS